MKKDILVVTAVLLMGIAITVNAQNKLPYKPLSAFDTDTIAFFHYNFNERADQYVGKTIAEILKDAQIPPKYFVPLGSMCVGNEDGIGIFFDNYTFYDHIERRPGDYFNDIYISIAKKTTLLHISLQGIYKIANSKTPPGF